MNLARRILEGIHEVELEITPEFQKPSDEVEGWGEPKRIPWGGSPRVDYEWKGKAIVRGVTAKGHGNAYAISWPRSSVMLKGHWGTAIRSIRKFDGWDEVYVYGVPESHMAEFDELNIQGIVSATFYPNNSDDDPTYDANIAGILGEYLGHDEKSWESV